MGSLGLHFAMLSKLLPTVLPRFFLFRLPSPSSLGACFSPEGARRVGGKFIGRKRVLCGSDIRLVMQVQQRAVGWFQGR